MRNLTGPSAGSTLVGVLGINGGGTGRSIADQAAVAINAIPYAQRNVAGGVAALDKFGKMNAANIPAEFFSLINVRGLTSVMKGTSNTYVITNFDTFTNYEVTTTVGTVTSLLDTIVYTAPLNTGDAGFSVNGQFFRVAVTDVAPSTPAITSPVNAANVFSTSYTLTSSAFAVVEGSSTHQSSDWQLSTNVGFTNVTISSINSTVNKTSFPATGLVPGTTYYGRVRYKSSSNSYSEYSPTVSFYAANGVILNSITVTGQGSGYISTPSVAVVGGGGSGATAVATTSAYNPGQAYVAPSGYVPGTNATYSWGNETVRNEVVSVDNNGNPISLNYPFGSPAPATDQSPLSYTYHLGEWTANGPNSRIYVIHNVEKQTTPGQSAYYTNPGQPYIAPSGGNVTAITLTNPGSGYTSIPSLTISGSGSGVSYNINTTVY